MKCKMREMAAPVFSLDQNCDLLGLIAEEFRAEVQAGCLRCRGARGECVVRMMLRIVEQDDRMPPEIF